MRGVVLFSVLLVILLLGCATKQAIVREKMSFGEEEEKAEPVQEQGQETGGEIMGKALFIIAQKNFRDEELSKPKQILERAGYGVDVASITTDTATGMLGGVVRPDLAVRDADITDYDMVVVVGGFGAPELAKHQEVIDLLALAEDKGKKLGAICLGPMVLAKAGVLQDKRATVYKTKESVAALEQGGAVFVDQSVVVDNDLVTANGPGAAEAFGNELVKLLRG